MTVDYSPNGGLDQAVHGGGRTWGCGHESIAQEAGCPPCAPNADGDGPHQPWPIPQEQQQQQHKHKQQRKQKPPSKLMAWLDERRRKVRAFCRRSIFRARTRASRRV